MAHLTSCLAANNNSTTSDPLPKQKQRKQVSWAPMSPLIVDSLSYGTNATHKTDSSDDDANNLAEREAAREIQININTAELQQALVHLDKDTVCQLTAGLPEVTAAGIQELHRVLREESIGLASSNPDSYRAGNLREAALTLEKELPGMVYCRPCETIHQVWSARELSQKVSGGEIPDADLSCATFNMVSEPGKGHRQLHANAITFGELQAAMKNYGAGNHRKADRYLKPFKQRRPLHPTKNYEFALIQDSSFARDNRLLLRTQHWHVIPRGSEIGLMILDKASTQHEAPAWPKVCRHILEQNGGHITWVEGEELGVLESCSKCATEYQIDKMEVENGLAIVMTVWKDIGRCSTPEDPRFTSHFFDTSLTEADYMKDVDMESPNNHYMGDIRRAFEGTEEYDLETSVLGVKWIFCVLTNEHHCSQDVVCRKCFVRYRAAVSTQFAIRKLHRKGEAVLEPESEPLINIVCSGGYKLQPRNSESLLVVHRPKPPPHIPA